ncbi:MAG: 2-dehydropantoate 2-reductase [Burkholderiales bacterium]
MKVCIFGAGAVGGHIATRLLAAKADEISVVARGAQLQAMRTRGLTLRTGGTAVHAKPALATDDPSTLPPQDVVAVSIKATGALPAAAEAIGKLLAPNGCAVFMINGIPWWWRHGRKGESGTLPLLDPAGALWQYVKPERTLGCVVHMPNEVVEPGVIVHTGPNHLVLGEPDGSASTRLQAVVDMFGRAGVETRVSKDIRRDIWQKLALNASGNTLAALTRIDLGGLGTDAGLCELSMKVMREAIAVAAAQGWDLSAEMDVEKLARRGKPGQRPSMLQDVTAGRALEVEALLGQIQAFARDLKIATPAIDVILPLLRGLDSALRAA